MVVITSVSESWAAQTSDVSVIVPTSLGGTGLTRCLASLVGQDLPTERFDVVVVQYGPDDGTRAAVADAQAARPGIRLTLLTETVASRSAAKNAGFDASLGELVVFVHDQDRLSRGYLSGVVAKPPAAGRITVPLVIDEVNDRPADLHSEPIRRVLTRAGRQVEVAKAPYLLTTGPGIVFSRTLLQRARFDVDLVLAEDAVLLGRLLSIGPLNCVVPPAVSDVVYRRSRRRGDQSIRVDPGHLLEGPARLAQLPPGEHLDPTRNQLATLASEDLNRYLQLNPDDHSGVIRHRRLRGLETVIDLSTLNRGVARDLAVLYTSVPYVDTSANVAARRISARGRIVDVISNNMTKRLATDPSSEALWAEYLDRRIEVVAHPSDTWWPGVTEFCRKGFSQFSLLEGSKGPYSSVYSRVMHPTSHFLAAWLKLRRPGLTWLAELSDPVRHDVRGNERPSSGSPDPIMMADFRAGLAARSFKSPASESLYLWLETLTYAFADEITFTNENQRAFMLAHFPDRVLAERAERHSLISHHPRPDPSLYSMVESDYDLPADRVNLAYFGVFYATRGLSEVWRALELLDDEGRDRVMLHVFTSKPDELTDELTIAGLIDVVRANPYVGYLEYLNLAANCDVLIVNDAHTIGIHDLNPYLPSKWSDYAGSGSEVWGIVEPGSVLSSRPLTYRSQLDDVEGALSVLKAIISAPHG